MSSVISVLSDSAAVPASFGSTSPDAQQVSGQGTAASSSHAGGSRSSGTVVRQKSVSTQEGTANPADDSMANGVIHHAESRPSRRGLQPFRQRAKGNRKKKALQPNAQVRLTNGANRSYSLVRDRLRRQIPHKYYGECEDVTSSESDVESTSSSTSVVEQWLVDAILDHRVVNGQGEYLVQWHDAPPDWRPLSDLHDCMQSIADFWRCRLEPSSAAHERFLRLHNLL